MPTNRRRGRPSPPPAPPGPDRLRYLVVLGVCLAVTLPLEFAYGARVWRRPLRLLRVVAVPAVAFSAWDVVAIRRGHWWFNPRFVTGWRLGRHLPVEEAAFFVTVPVCAILSWEAVRRSRGR